STTSCRPARPLRFASRARRTTRPAQRPLPVWVAGRLAPGASCTDAGDAMPPIHPAIVHFPITLVVCALIADLIAFGTRSTFWRAAGFWSWMTALVTAALAVGAGYYDMNRATLSAEADGLVHLHMRVGWTLLIVCTAVAFWRWRIEVAAPARPSALYVLASLLLFGLTAFQGWYGSEMVY